MGPGAISHKVAPGMEAVFMVMFCPEDDQDFTGGLVVITEREAFEVPVLGTGAALSMQSRAQLLSPADKPGPTQSQASDLLAGCCLQQSAR